MSYRTLGFPENGVTNTIYCKCGFTPGSNPKGGNTNNGNWKDINLFKNAKANKTVS